MARTIILLLCIVSAAMVAGCGAFVTPSNRLSSGALEIPPDLTAPNTIGATRVPNITGAPMSAQTVSEFEQFQSKEQLADYQDFLEWRRHPGRRPHATLSRQVPRNGLQHQSRS